MTQSHFYAVIIAGGQGTRLWPLSRKSKPKQFQSFLSTKTMLEETFDRVAAVVPPENIFISTTTDYRHLVLETLPSFPAKRLILEPVPRGTAAAIALVADRLVTLDPEAIVATIASDHAVKNTEEFSSTIETALQIASKYPDKLVTIGINPTWPDTGLGYIKMGEEVDQQNGKRIFFVDTFKEKPDQKTAEKYLASWEYLWNASYFIFSAKHFLLSINELSPNILETLEKMSAIPEEDAETAKKRSALYAALPNEPIDTLIVEKLPPEKRLVIPAPLEWSDVGNWSTLFDFLENRHGSSLISQGNHMDVGSEKCYVHAGKKLIATLGLKNIIIVETDDALLIADKHSSQEMKTLIEKLRENSKQIYL